VNCLAERHQLTILYVALTSLADSADERHGLKPLSDRFAGYALLYANDLHNAVLASETTVGRTPYEGLLGRQATLGVLRHFGCRCWVHTPGKPFVHHRKFDLRARPGTFLGFDQPFGSAIYEVLLDSGEVTQSQMVFFDDAPNVPPPVLLPEVAAKQQLGGKGHPLGFWCDANFAACRDAWRSTTGWVVTMYGGAVSWSSKKQATSAASTMDAKYQACGAAAREGMSLRKALGEMALLLSDFLLGGRVMTRCDNKAALSLCKDRKEEQRVKHVDVVQHFAHDHVASGELSFVHCKSVENVSDCLTKVLSRPLFEKGLEGLGIIST
jgi:hypothetical protein